MQDARCKMRAIGHDSHIQLGLSSSVAARNNILRISLLILLPSCHPKQQLTVFVLSWLLRGTMLSKANVCYILTLSRFTASVFNARGSASLKLDKPVSTFIHDLAKDFSVSLPNLTSSFPAISKSPLSQYGFLPPQPLGLRTQEICAASCAD